MPDQRRQRAREGRPGGLPAGAAAGPRGDQLAKAEMTEKAPAGQGRRRRRRRRHLRGVRADLPPARPFVGRLGPAPRRDAFYSASSGRRAVRAPRGPRRAARRRLSRGRPPAPQMAIEEGKLIKDTLTADPPPRRRAPPTPARPRGRCALMAEGPAEEIRRSIEANRAELGLAVERLRCRGHRGHRLAQADQQASQGSAHRRRRRRLRDRRRHRRADRPAHGRQPRQYRGPDGPAPAARVAAGAVPRALRQAGSPDPGRRRRRRATTPAAVRPQAVADEGRGRPEPSAGARA